MNENLLTIEKRSSINGTFWKKRFTNNNINTDNDDDMYDLNNIINLNKMMESNDNII